mmetsp:Transcript_6164/g.15300  ORF Transcript_6164/g.15300 Transcript_6164/m.15300 type:complete len:223 (-) Transcript_6164:1457-2125(-)
MLKHLPIFGAIVIGPPVMVHKGLHVGDLAVLLGQICCTGVAMVSRLRKFLAKPPYLCLEFRNHVAPALVHRWLRPDLFRCLREREGARDVVEVFRQGRNRYDDGCGGIAREGLREQQGELGIPEIFQRVPVLVGRAFRKSLDHARQMEQRRVDRYHLPELRRAAVARASTLVLTSSEVQEHDRALDPLPGGGPTFLALVAGELVAKSKHGMASGRTLVHRGR